MCCGGNSNKDGPKWKREVVQDHKFDYVDMNEFYDNSCGTRLSYMFMYVIILKGFLVYVADIWSAVSLLVVGQTNENMDAAIPPDVSKWIFLGAIMISFILLFWDIRKSRGIIKSRDISYTFFSIIANRYFSVKDYKYFCLFQKINRSRKSIDSIAFFVFFTLKGWKRLLLAEAPRQIINIVTLQALVPKWIQIKNGVYFTNEALGKDVVQQIMTGTMAFSVLVFAISFILVCIAAIIYIPLLCHIRGNLKEYCCHKVDKRIAELLRKQANKRIAKNNKNGKNYQNHNNSNHHYNNKSKKDVVEMQSLPQPTLPNVDMNNHLTTNYARNPTAMAHQHQRQYSDNNNSMMGGTFRRNSLNSVNSDQVGLTSYAQDQPYSNVTYHHYNSPQLSQVSLNNQIPYQQQNYYHHQQQQSYNYNY
ncbi:hypothetical protein K501DRAFT_255702 [Backusella circina FSU 941]|nr:hypothetical protein K501DRAFT_255702 [Backusella circina FSU 941]